MFTVTTDLTLAIGIMITVGVLGGVLSAKVRFPRVTGYIVVGIILSPSVLNLISPTTIDKLDIITHVSLGIVAYLIGASLRIDPIRRLAKNIFWITPFESLGAWLVVTLALTFLIPAIAPSSGVTSGSNYLLLALVVGAISSATAPAVTIAVVRELKAKGPLTTTLTAVVALDDSVAVIGSALALGIARLWITGTGNASFYQILTVPTIEILGAIGIGTALGFLLIYIIRFVKTRAVLLSAVMGIIILCTGLANFLGVSLIMANMAIGFVVTNRLQKDEPIAVVENIEETVFNIFFVFSGMHFDVSVMRTAGIIALALFGARFAGKYFGAVIGAKISRASEAVKKYLGFALIPQAGVALGLALLARSIFPTLGSLIFNVILASVIINELVAPPFTKYAITKAGEAEEAGKLMSEPR